MLKFPITYTRILKKYKVNFGIYRGTLSGGKKKIYIYISLTAFLVIAARPKWNKTAK